eukprot:jgi/Chlat1/3608/Chrsp235S03605
MAAEERIPTRFERNVYERDHALIMPESCVFRPLHGWYTDPVPATPLPQYHPKAWKGHAHAHDGAINLHSTNLSPHELQVDGYAYFPSGHKPSIESTHGAILWFESNTTQASVLTTTAKFTPTSADFGDEAFYMWVGTQVHKQPY